MIQLNHHRQCDNARTNIIVPSNALHVMNFSSASNNNENYSMNDCNYNSSSRRRTRTQQQQQQPLSPEATTTPIIMATTEYPSRRQSFSRPTMQSSLFSSPTTQILSSQVLVSLAWIIIAVMATSSSCSFPVSAFVVSPSSSSSSMIASLNDLRRSQPSSSSSSSTTSLNVWWFGGTQGSEVTTSTTSTTSSDDGDSCELVAVRIERTSPNSRRIAGDIVVPTSIDNVWQILTDYNRLAIHVPNLVESKVVRELQPTTTARAMATTPVAAGRIANVGANGQLQQRRRPTQQPSSSSRPGDGRYRCRLFQKGAQKIIGFDFSASVTMDMTEQFIVPPPSLPLASSSSSSSLPPQEERQQQQQRNPRPQERRINFKCVDSQFFTEFDGDWTVKEQFNDMTGQIETVCTYVVDVRPKGPVPVAALEWRIREDVPSNLRAVKAASMLRSAQLAQSRQLTSGMNAGTERTVGQSSSTAAAPGLVSIDSAASAMGQAVRRAAANARNTNQNRRLAAVPVLNDWDKDETMAKYL